MAKTEKGAEAMTSGNVKSSEPIDKNDVRKDLVIIYATSSAPHHKEGTETKVHPEMAKLWIAKGWFTKDKPKQSKKEDDLL